MNNMNRPINVLLIDDHPIITDAYQTSLNIFSEQTQTIFNIYKAYCSDSALSLLTNDKNDVYDIVFLDIRIPKSKTHKINDGKDLGLLIRKLKPHAKIIVSTAYIDPFILDDLLKKLNPEGLLCKSDIDFKIVKEAVKNILNDVPFYSSSILRALRKKVSSGIVLDNTDKALIEELAKGAKTKDLVGKIPLSLGGIEKRKRYLKEVFHTEGKSDKKLIEAIKEHGFI